MTREVSADELSPWPYPPGIGRRSVTELYGRHEGEDIYVVGTGPSLRVFPTEVFEGKITIGLNLAWRSFTPTYGMTIHPELNIPEFLAEPEARPEITWVTKREKFVKFSEERKAYADRHYYYFRTDGKPNTQTDGQSDAGRLTEWLLEPHGEFLYLWSSIAQPAINLAAHMGARNVILVGCDNSVLFGNHHATGQHTMWVGASPDDRYQKYYLALAEVREALRRRNVNVVSMHPFLTLGPHEPDFLRLCEELGRPDLIPQEDVSHIHRPPPPTLVDKIVRRVRKLLR